MCGLSVFNVCVCVCVCVRAITSYYLVHNVAADFKRWLIIRRRWLPAVTGSQLYSCNAVLCSERWYWCLLSLCVQNGLLHLSGFYHVVYYVICYTAFRVMYSPLRPLHSLVSVV